MLAMLLSFFAVAEDGMTEIGLDQPIEIEGEVVGDGETRDGEGEPEIEMDEAEGLPDGDLDPEGGDIDLALDLDGAALETDEEALAPETGEAMMDGPSTPTGTETNPFLVTDWDVFAQDVTNNSDKKTVGTEGEKSPTYFKLNFPVAPKTNTPQQIIVGGSRYIVLDLNGCTLSRNLGEDAVDDGYVIKVNGTLTIRDKKGTGGKITGGYCTENGGGVIVADGGKLILESGEISGNRASGYGGGVYVEKGGIVAGNHAGSQVGGGVYVDPNGTFNLSGAVQIEGNKNNAGVDSNVRLDSGVSINVTGKLTRKAGVGPIGVSVEDEISDTYRVFTKGLPGNGTDEDFESEQGAGYGVMLVPAGKGTDAKEAMLAKAVTVTFNPNGGKETMKPQNVVQGMDWPLNPNQFTRPGYRFTGWNTNAGGSGTKYADEADVKLTQDITLYAQWEKLEVEVGAFDRKGYEYTGKPITPEVVVKDKKTGKTLEKGKDYEVEYRNNVNAGDPAQAYILMKGAYEGVDVPVKDFKINPKPITVTARDQTKAQGDKDPELTYDVDGLVEGDKLKGALTREEGEEPGTYKIRRGTLTGGSNYDIVKFTEGTLTITAKPEDKPEDKTEDKPEDKPEDKTEDKPEDKPTDEPTDKPEDETKTKAKANFTLLARMTDCDSSKKALRVRWTKVSDADGYDVFFARCGKDYKSKNVATVTSTSVRYGGLKKKAEYKAFVRAWKRVDGRKVYIGKASPEVHAITGGYDSRRCNARCVTLSRTRLTLKVGKSKTIRASVKGVKSGRKLIDHERKVRWYSSNVNVATVDRNGKVKAKGKGACTLYAIAINGVRSSVKVTVK